MLESPLYPLTLIIILIVEMDKGIFNGLRKKTCVIKKYQMLATHFHEYGNQEFCELKQYFQKYIVPKLKASSFGV